MKLTPLDIRKQLFKKVMRGYDTVEVDTFMEMTANEFEDLLKMHKEMREKLLEVETHLKDYRQVEKTLQQTLMQLQETTGRTYEAARRDAEVILKEAEIKAAGVLQDAVGQLSRVKNDVLQLQGKRDSLVARLKMLLTTELDLLKTMELGDEDLVTTSPSLGTGKDSFDLDEVWKSIEHDGTPHPH